jgi:hypothetical protein
MGWLCSALCRYVQWPSPWVQYSIGTEMFQDPNLIRDRSDRRLADLLETYGVQGVLVITVVRLPAPALMRDGWRVCRPCRRAGRPPLPPRRATGAAGRPRGRAGRPRGPGPCEGDGGAEFHRLKYKPLPAKPLPSLCQAPFPTSSPIACQWALCQAPFPTSSPIACQWASSPIACENARRTWTGRLRKHTMKR